MPLVNFEVLTELVKTDTLKIVKKSQKTDGSNYYFTPSLSLQLYNARVRFITSKFVVFEFDRIKHASLLGLLKSVNNSLLFELRRRYSELYNKDVYNMYSETDDKFTIRCFLPNSSGKYHIQVNSNQNERLTFHLPRVDACYDIATVEIRNVWVNGERRGFNLELKAVHFIN